MKTTQFALFKTARFLPLFVVQFLGAFNDNVFKNAFVILITYRLAALSGLNAQILVTLAAGIFILPFFLFSATAGQLADKYEKSRLISIIKIYEIVIMALATVGFYLQSTYFLMTVLFLLGAQATFFGPLKYAMLPEQLRENELIAGNGLIEAGTFLAILLGTIIGGILILYPHGEVIISTMILMLALVGWMASLFIPITQTYSHALNVSYNFLKETINLIRYSGERKEILVCILGISWFWFVGATFLAEFPVFVKNILHADESVVTLFLALFSIGLALGSVLCNVVLKEKIHTIYVPFAAVGITIFTVDLYFASQAVPVLSGVKLIDLSQFLQTITGWRLVIDMLLIAISGGIYSVPLYATLQHQSDKQHISRVIASNNIVNALFMVFSAIFTMLLFRWHFTVSQVYLMVGIINGVMAIYLFKSNRAATVRERHRR